MKRLNHTTQRGLKRIGMTLWCLLIGVGVARLTAQSRLEIEDYSHRLSEHMVTCMRQDARGFLWFSTWNGLHRFDGYHFKNYKTYPGEECVMISNRLLMININQSGSIWCLDDDRNVYLFDPTTERFHALKMRSPISPVHNIVCATDSTSYFVAEDRVVRVDERVFDPTTGEGVTEWPFAYLSKQNRAQRVINVLHCEHNQPCIVTDRAVTLPLLNQEIAIPEEMGAVTAATLCGKRIYLATTTNRLGIVTPTKESLEWVQLPLRISRINFLTTLDEEYIAIGNDRGLLLYTPYTHHFKHIDPARSGCGSSYVTSLYCDSKKNLWIHTNREGVVRYHTQTDEMQYLVSPKGDLAAAQVSSTPICFEDQLGTCWVIPRGGSLSWFDPHTKQLRSYTTDMQQNGTKPLPAIVISFLDQQGNLWYSGLPGLYRLSFSAINLRHQTLDEEFETRAMMVDLKGRFWVATKRGTIRIFNPDRSLAGYLGMDGVIHPTPCYFTGNIYCFLETADGTIWMGTRLHGLVRLDPAGKDHFRITRYLHNPTDPYSLSDNSVFDLFKDSRNRIWACTYGGGINCLQQDESGKVRFLHAGNELVNWPIKQCAKTRQITERQGTLMVGTTTGLVTFSTDFDDPHTIRFYLNRLQPNESSCLPANDIHGLFTDSRGDSYVMSFTGGVSRILSEDLCSEQIQFYNYSLKDGMSSELAHSMVEDNMGKLWVIYKNGIDRFDPTTNTFECYGNRTHNYTEAKPLFNNNHLVVGTANGIAYLAPRKLHKSSYVPPIGITSLTIQSTGEERMVDHLDRISLEPNQRDIQIHFSALDYVDNQSLRYRYRMAGLEEMWVHIAGQPSASYTNLPAGNYRFEICSTNSHGVWVENLRTIEIEVIPTFWETPFAIVFLIVTILALLLGAIQLRLHIFRLRHRIDVEQHLTDIKLRFFTNVSHELRTPLTLIASPIDEVLEHEYLSEQGRHHLQVVSQNTQRMLRMINEILDFRKIESGKMKLLVESCELAALTERIADNFRTLAQRRHNDFVVHLPEQGQMGWIDRDKVEKICFNLLSNAFKYTPEERGVRFEVTCNEASLVIVVSDEGIGMDSKAQARLFRRFETILGTTNFPSSGIGLSLVKELLDLMGGQIEMESTPGVGSCFTVKLPIHRSHYEQLPYAELIVGDIPHPMHETTLPDNATASDDQAQQATILIVEDNCELNELLHEMLSAEYHILTASNGVEGLQIARKALPDLILTDVMMPEMDGLEMVRRIKENRELCHLPIIVLSAKSSLDDRIEGLEQGIDDYITKPFVASYLKIRIRRLLERYRLLRESMREQLTQEQPHGCRYAIPELPEPHILSSDEQFLQALMELLERNMDRAEMTIEEFASALNMAHSTFYNKVKSLIGLTPVEFIREVRLKRARQLLRSGPYDVSTVSYMVGFTDPRYFSKCFKKHFGVTPSQLRTTKE